MATQSGRPRGTRGTEQSTRSDVTQSAGSETAEVRETATGSTGPRTEPASGFHTDSRRGWTGVLKEAATSRISNQKQRATESIDQVARALRDTTDRMQEQGPNAIADYTRQAADQLERFSRRLDQQDLDELMRGAQRFARSQPWVFVGAAFGLGLVAARFFKSSSGTSAPGREDDWRSVGGTTYTRPASSPGFGMSGPAESIGDYRTGPTT
jgi:hypothetical protein